MNGAAIEAPEQPVNVEEQARIVMNLLREYAEKLSTLNRELASCSVSWQRGNPREQAAWLLDQSELIRRPLLTILSRGSGLRENAPLESITRDELSLRMTETELHLHHMIRQAGELRAQIEQKKLMAEVAKLRLVAGLSAMPGGPLHPE